MNNKNIFNDKREYDPLDNNNSVLSKINKLVFANGQRPQFNNLPFTDHLTGRGWTPEQQTLTSFSSEESSAFFNICLDELGQHPDNSEALLAFQYLFCDFSVNQDAKVEALSKLATTANNLEVLDQLSVLIAVTELRNAVKLLEEYDQENNKDYVGHYIGDPARFALQYMTDATLPVDFNQPGADQKFILPVSYTDLNIVKEQRARDQELFTPNHISELLTEDLSASRPHDIYFKKLAPIIEDLVTIAATDRQLTIPGITAEPTKESFGENGDEYVGHIYKNIRSGGHERSVGIFRNENTGTYMLTMYLGDANRNERRWVYIELNKDNAPKIITDSRVHGLLVGRWEQYSNGQVIESDWSEEPEFGVTETEIVNLTKQT